MVLRLLLVVLVAVAAAGVLARRRRPGAPDAPVATLPPLPATLRDGAARTWVIFTTRYCVSCEGVEARLRAAEPGARIVRVDAEAEPGLVRAYRVRTAPTTLLAGADGSVQARLVGPAAVERFVGGVSGR